MKFIFTIINSLCVILAAYVFVDMAYKKAVPQLSVAEITQGVKKIEKASGNSQKLLQMNPAANMVILKRNLFKVEVENNSSQKNISQGEVSEKLEHTSLSLVLFGTVVGPNETYAVIEDKKIRQQALYNVGDSVQGAEIKQILRHKVILLFQGKKQVLIMEDKPSKSSKISKAPANIPQIKSGGFQTVQKLDRDNLPEMASNLMRQIKFRPHITDGEPDGLMIYGIRPSSIFRKIGLRNGDIIKEVNGTQVLTEADAIGVFGEIVNADQAKVTLMRRGKIEEVVYSMPDEF